MSRVAYTRSIFEQFQAQYRQVQHAMQQFQDWRRKHETELFESLSSGLNTIQAFREYQLDIETLRRQEQEMLENIEKIKALVEEKRQNYIEAKQLLQQAEKSKQKVNEILIHHREEQTVIQNRKEEDVLDEYNDRRRSA